VFTGAGVKYDFGDAAPGLQFRAHGGWAWREHTVRGGAALSDRRADWEYTARAERQITPTNDLSGALAARSDAPPLIGDDKFFDRRFAGLLVQTTGSHGLAWRFEFDRASDHVAGRNAVAFAPLAPGEQAPPMATGDSAVSRAVFAGAYWLGRAELRVNSAGSAVSLDPRAQLRVALETATGDLTWQRYEIGGALRHRTGRWTFSVAGDAGIVRSTALPPQALYQLRQVSDFYSAANTLPFTGDRGALARGGVMYTLPVLSAPTHVGKYTIPGLAPSPFVGLQSAWTGASPTALSLMNRFGWRTSNGGRSAADVGIGFFGGSVGVGVVRAFDATGKWRFGARGRAGY
jgi:hypothetical protein